MSKTQDLFAARRTYGGRTLVRHPICTNPELALEYQRVKAEADERARRAADGLGVDTRLASPDEVRLAELEEQIAEQMVVVVMRRPTPEREEAYLAELAALPPNSNTVEQEKRLVLECFDHFEVGGERDDEATVDDLRGVLDDDLIDRRELIGLSNELLSRVSGDLIPKSLMQYATTAGRGKK